MDLGINIRLSSAHQPSHKDTRMLETRNLAESLKEKRQTAKQKAFRSDSEAVNHTLFLNSWRRLHHK